MSAGEIIFMVLVVGVAILMAVLNKKIPAWLGFILMLAAGAAVAVGGIATKSYKVVPVGVGFIVSTITLWIASATSNAATSEDPDTLGGAASKAAWWAWLVASVLVIAGFGIGFALP